MEQHALCFDRFLLSSVLDVDSVQLEKWGNFMKLLNDAIIESLRVLANMDFFSQASSSFEKPVEHYFMVEILFNIMEIGNRILLIEDEPKLGKVKFAMISGRYLKGMSKKSANDVDLLLVGAVVIGLEINVFW